MPEAEQGMNVARIASLRAGLPVEVPAQTVNRFCSSGLQTIALAAQQIMSGMGEAVIAGGVETMSQVPMSSNKFMANPTLAKEHPGVYIGMGQTAENLARQYEVTREEQDAFALRSHQRAAAAQDAGKFDDEIVPLEVEITLGEGSSVQTYRTTFDRDEGIRRDSSAEALAKLRPVFHVQGDSHSRQQQPDQRRRRGSAGDERGEGGAAGACTDGPFPQLRGRRRRARIDGNRPRDGRAQGAQAGRCEL